MNIRPPGADARLAELRSYDVLDTPPEKDFDDIARLARAADTGRDYWRGEFLSLIELAEARSAPGGTGGGDRR